MQSETEMLTRPQAARYLGIRPQTLAVWSCQGRGPRLVKLGRAVRYRRADLDDYVEQNTTHPEFWRQRAARERKEALAGV